MYFRPSSQNFDNWRFWIRKNKRIEQDDIDKIYLYAKDLSEHEILIKKCENAGIKYFNDPNVFIECSNTIHDIYENIDDYNPIRKRKIFIVLTT